MYPTPTTPTPSPYKLHYVGSTLSNQPITGSPASIDGNANQSIHLIDDKPIRLGCLAEQSTRLESLPRTLPPLSMFQLVQQYSPYLSPLDFSQAHSSQLFDSHTQNTNAPASPTPPPKIQTLRSNCMIYPVSLISSSVAPTPQRIMKPRVAKLHQSNNKIPLYRPSSPSASSHSYLPSLVDKKKRYTRQHCFWPGCNSSFSNKSHLARHQRIHTNEKPFPCLKQGCTWRFARPDHLKQHLDKVHCSDSDDSEDDGEYHATNIATADPTPTATVKAAASVTTATTTVLPDIATVTTASAPDTDFTQGQEDKQKSHASVDSDIDYFSWL